VEYQAQREARLDGDRRVDRMNPHFPVASACHAVTASSGNPRGQVPRLTSAASYSGQRDGDRAVSLAIAPIAICGIALIGVQARAYSRANAQYGQDLIRKEGFSTVC
jgi:hypothetical protein